MSNTFDDFDPEDAWDDDDPIEDKMHILERVVTSLRSQGDEGRFEGRRTDALRLVGKLERIRLADPRLQRIRHELEAL